MALDYAKLDPLEFIKSKFKGPDCTSPYTVRSYFTLKCLSKFYAERLASVQPNSLRVLDYGCGPFVVNVISAAPKAAEIVLADFTQSFRRTVQEWLDNNQPEYDWSHVFKHVVQTLEGKPEDEVTQRVDELRKKVSAVVFGDVMQDSIIAEGYEGPYDVVTSFHCLEVCASLDLYKAGLRKLASHVVNGGFIVLSATKRDQPRSPFYRVNGVKYYNVLPTSKAFIVDSLVELGFVDICEDYVHINPSADSNADGFYFFSAHKPKQDVPAGCP
jgi:2-polyprenyl-3-methyl-5-hydroxy-6-metoxy-1,4-benzoquinol methylase